MKKLTIFLLCSFMGIVSCQTPTKTNPHNEIQADLAITNISVINTTDGSVDTSQTLLIRGNKITSIEAYGDKLSFTDSTLVINAAGKYVIPGLWDMHMHAMHDETMVNMNGRDYKTLLPLFIANGVTGVRDMWGKLNMADSVRNAVLTNEIAGPPRIYVAGAIVNGPGPYPHTIAKTPDEGRAIVDSLYHEGATFIKVYFQLPKETYDAINERSKELGIYIAGHTPFELGVGYCSDAGQRSIEHMTGVVWACSNKEDSLINTFQKALKTNDHKKIISVSLDKLPNEALATQNDAVMHALFQKLIKNQTWQVPTLVSLYGKAYLNRLQSQEDARIKYYAAPPRWLGPGPFGFPFSDNHWQTLQKLYEREKELVGLMAKAGVPLLAGTDFGTPYVFPGFSIHDELQLFVEAGMSPLQSLQTATLNPARFFDRTDELGTVEVGKLADLLILEANPLDDIRNTEKIHTVIADGRLYTRADLDKMLQEVEVMVKAEKENQ